MYASTAAPADMSDSNYHPPGGSGPSGFGSGGPANTLDEPVWDTVSPAVHLTGHTLLSLIWHITAILHMPMHSPVAQRICSALDRHQWQASALDFTGW